VANIYRDSYVRFFGSLGTGLGELIMERLGRGLDTDGIPDGALLSDRTFRCGWDAMAASFLDGAALRK